MPSEKDRMIYEALARDISEIPGIMSCTIIDLQGATMGNAAGEIPHRADIMEKVGAIAAVIWGGVSIVEPEAGALTSVIISYRTFRIIGIPVSSKGVAILVTASVLTDPYQLITLMSAAVASMDQDREEP